MTPRDSVLPATLAAALDLLAEHRYRVVAGGTHLVPRNRRGADVPVDLGAPPLFIRFLPELGTLDAEGGYTIGATVTLAALRRSPACPPGFAEVIDEFASPAVRASATVGGNVCNASPAADLLPPLLAHDAEIAIASREGTRRLTVADFVRGPGAVALDATELAVRVVLPASPLLEGETYRYYRKVAPRRSNALSKLSIYVAAAARGGRLTSSAIALGAVAPTVVRRRELEERIVGLTAAELRARGAALVEQYESSLRPIDDQRSTQTYRRATALRMLRFVLTEDLPRYVQHTEEP